MFFEQHRRVAKCCEVAKGKITPLNRKRPQKRPKKKHRKNAKSHKTRKRIIMLPDKNAAKIELTPPISYGQLFLFLILIVKNLK